MAAPSTGWRACPLLGGDQQADNAKRGRARVLPLHLPLSAVGRRSTDLPGWYLSGVQYRVYLAGGSGYRLKPGSGPRDEYPRGPPPARRHRVLAMSSPPTLSGQPPSAVHRAVLEVYDAFRGVIFTAFPTTTNPSGKSPPDDARRRLDRLCAAMVPFPERRLYPDPFAHLHRGRIRLQLRAPSPKMSPPDPIDGTSAHDVMVRLAGRVYDRLVVIRLREMTDPATGETFMGADYPHGYEYQDDDGETVLCPGQPAVEHYTAAPWSAELWDRLYDAHFEELFPFCFSYAFNPHPGTLRVELEREGALVPDPPPATPVSMPAGNQPGDGSSTGIPATGTAGLSEAGAEQITNSLKEFLAVELARIGNNATPPDEPPPPAARVRCDRADHSVSLDEKLLTTGLSADQFQFVSAVAEAHPVPISFKKIMGGNTKGKNPTRIKDAINDRVRGAMPARHLDFILGQDGVGYRLNLPPESCHE